MAIAREEMFHKLTLRYEELVCKYADKNVTDEQFFNELCCSVYAGEEFEKSERKKTIKLNKDCCFKYKGHDFELTPCTMLNSKQQVIDTAGTFVSGGTKPIFTDRYVCWMIRKINDDESEWHLVPGAWAWGAEFDCNPGDAVDYIILDAIDKFLEQNPDL